jgi:hypothetical protein
MLLRSRRIAGGGGDDLGLECVRPLARDAFGVLVHLILVLLGVVALAAGAGLGAVVLLVEATAVPECTHEISYLMQGPR